MEAQARRCIAIRWARCCRTPEGRSSETILFGRVECECCIQAVCYRSREGGVRRLRCSGRELVYCLLLHGHDPWHLTVGRALEWRVECARRPHMDVWGLRGCPWCCSDRGGTRVSLSHVHAAVRKTNRDTTLSHAWKEQRCRPCGRYNSVILRSRI